MGYDLHITRAKRWTESEAHPISDAEWRACLAANPELEQISAHFFDGRVVVKNPDDAAIAKMIELAGKLGAHVEGDDGEVYEVAGHPPRPATLSFRDRVASWLERLRPQPTFDPVVLPFKEGDRVRDTFGHEATVVSIDLAAQVGLGAVVVRYDDGREITFMAVAHGLTQV